jgi:hypothetical protein
LNETRLVGADMGSPPKLAFFVAVWRPGRGRPASPATSLQHGGRVASGMLSVGLQPKNWQRAPPPLDRVNQMALSPWSCRDPPSRRLVALPNFGRCRTRSGRRQSIPGRAYEFTPRCPVSELRDTLRRPLTRTSETRGALATRMFLVPLFDLKFPIRARGNWYRNFKSAAQARSVR